MIIIIINIKEAHIDGTIGVQTENQNHLPNEKWEVNASLHVWLSMMAASMFHTKNYECVCVSTSWSSFGNKKKLFKLLKKIFAAKKIKMKCCEARISIFFPLVQIIGDHFCFPHHISLPICFPLFSLFHFSFFWFFISSLASVKELHCLWVMTFERQNEFVYWRVYAIVLNCTAQLFVICYTHKLTNSQTYMHSLTWTQFNRHIDGPNDIVIVDWKLSSCRDFNLSICCLLACCLTCWVGHCSIEKLGRKEDPNLNLFPLLHFQPKLWFKPDAFELIVHIHNSVGLTFAYSLNYTFKLCLICCLSLLWIV